MRFRMVLACLRENMECVRVCVRCRVCLPLVCLMIVFLFAVSRNRAVYAHWTQSQDAVASRVFGMMLLIPSTIEPQWVLLFVVAGMKTETSVFRLRGEGSERRRPDVGRTFRNFLGFRRNLCCLALLANSSFGETFFFFGKGFPDHCFSARSRPTTVARRPCCGTRRQTRRGVGDFQRGGESGTARITQRIFM